MRSIGGIRKNEPDSESEQNVGSIAGWIESVEI